MFLASAFEFARSISRGDASELVLVLSEEFSD
jgi:hypothetical protein